MRSVVRRQTCVVFCGRNQEILNDLQQVFTTDYYHIWTSTDIVGVEVSAALKNAYAMGVCLATGMLDLVGVDGLANMYNPQAALFAQSCLEMKRFLEIMGSGTDHIFGLPGPGDLFVTVYGGRTARLGRLLGKGVSFTEARQQLAGVTLESVEIITRVARALPKLKTRGIVSPGLFPLLTHLDEIINQGKAVNLPWKRFF
jgi:glycerol-3-phosphate dehydrogenase (NAD(P)+)